MIENANYFVYTNNIGGLEVLSNELIEKFQLLSKYSDSSLEEMEKLLKINRKYLILQIEKINDVLESFHFPVIEVKGGRIRTPAVSLNSLFEKISHHTGDYLFHEERLEMIVLYILLAQHFVSNQHLQNLLQMSRNSVLSDIKRLKQHLLSYQIELSYTRKQGYFLAGKTKKLIYLLEKTLSELLSIASGRWVLRYLLEDCGLELNDGEVVNRLVLLGKKYNIHFLSEKTKEVSCLIAILKAGSLKICPDDDIVLGEIYTNSLFDLCEELLQTYPELADKKNFIFSRLLGCTEGNLQVFSDQRVFELMEDIIEQVKAHTGADFSQSPQFRQNLYSHLYPAYYRLLFDIPLINPLKEQIKADFGSLYYLVKRSLIPLEEYVGKLLSDDEVAYFTIHFGGYLEGEYKKDSIQTLRALSICPNGVSSSLILQAELKHLFPNMMFKPVHQLDEAKKIDIEEYDLAFSTVPFESERPVYILQPVMKAVEKTMLKRRVISQFSWIETQGISLDGLIEIIERHTTIHHYPELMRELSNYLIGWQQGQTRGGYGLTELLKKEFIQQTNQVKDWKEAISLAAAPLLRGNYIEQSYIEGMIASVEKLGAYIVLAPKVAVPHAAPDLGVNKVGMSLLQVAEPVDFDVKGDEEKQVQLIFVLAAIDSTAHLKALQELAMILDDDESIEQLIAAENLDEIMEIITETIKNGEKYD